MLYVTVLHARHLPATDRGSSNVDCAVRCRSHATGLGFFWVSHLVAPPQLYMLPERSRDSKRKTTLKSETLNPTWNETFVYASDRGAGTGRAVAHDARC